MKAVADYQNRIYNLKNYEDELPFNRRARMDKLQAYACQLIDTIRRLDRHFNPAAESG